MGTTCSTDTEAKDRKNEAKLATTFSQSYKGVTFGNLQGNICFLECDVIICPSNYELKLNSGLANSILVAGGEVIQDQCDSIMADKPGLQVGEVEVTDAGELKAKHIVHIVCPIWFDGAHKEPEKLAQCVLNALKKCDELETVKISIPSLTSGIYGFPRDLCAKIVTESALKYFDQVTETKIKTINFVNTDVATTKEFESKLKQNIDNVVRLT